jgi:hypothetical protein
MIIIFFTLRNCYRGVYFPAELLKQVQLDILQVLFFKMLLLLSLLSFKSYRTFQLFDWNCITEQVRDFIDPDVLSCLVRRHLILRFTSFIVQKLMTDRHVLFRDLTLRLVTDKTLIVLEPSIGQIFLLHRIIIARLKAIIFMTHLFGTWTILRT